MAEDCGAKVSNEFEGSLNKKQKLNDPNKRYGEIESVIYNNSVHDNIKDLSGFKLKKVLSNNTNRKTIFLSGQFEQGDDAIVILEKTAFAEEQLIGENNYFSKKSTLKKVFQNDIYGDYTFFPVSALNTIKTTIIHPATEKHIVKYSSQKAYIVDETPKIYDEVVLPHITSNQLNLQWVYNILEHKSEVERIVFEDIDPTDGFVLLPDLKWNGEIESLYLLAICHRRNLKSLRDLTGEHLPLLKNIRDKGQEAIKERYGLDSSQLRIYLHYQPSFYHLHVHFTFLGYEAPGILAERSHLLTTVINNIKLMTSYYSSSTIPFTIRENDDLFKKFNEAGVLRTEQLSNDDGRQHL